MLIIESKQRGIYSFSRLLCRDNICLPLSRPMTNFNIEHYEKTSLENKIIPIDTMLKLNNQKINQFWEVLLLIDPETSPFLY